jgi:hypothetical protein
VRVVACDTPSGVGLQKNPCSSATNVTVTPNTRLFTTPLPTSAQTSTPPCICDQNEPLSMPISGTATSQPPMMPTALNTAASSGIAMTPPQKRGASTRCTGSTAIISIAESCSPAFIRPISAVSEVPARPANSRAVTTGPSSRTSDSATSRPTASAEP